MVAFPMGVHEILCTLEQQGYEAYLVGGCVRDLLLGKVPFDWDITTSARPQEVLTLFPDSIPTGLPHGTVTVKAQGEAVEVTTFRADGAYADHRHPAEVHFTRSLQEDLLRRDFTVNAMAMDRQGTLYDFYGGQDDLRQGVLRCVGDPDRRFSEDALRIMRALRFAATLGFAIEAKTAESLCEHRQDLSEIAAERLYAEMTKLLCGQNAAEILLQYPAVIGVFLPEILPCVGLEQHNPHHCYDVWGHTAHSVAAIAPDPVLRWAMLLHDLGKGSTFSLDEHGVGHFYGHGKASVALAEKIAARLRFSGEMRQRVIELVDWHDRDVPRTEKSIRRCLYHLGEDGVRRLIAVKRADNVAQHPDYQARAAEIDKAEQILQDILDADACFSLKQLAVNGNDLMELGLRGKAVGETLDFLLKQVIDGNLPNDRKVLLAQITKK